MSWPFYPTIATLGRGVRVVERLRERGARPRQPLAGGIGADREHGRRLRDVQPLHADQQQHLAVDVGQRRERALEIAAAGIVAGARPGGELGERRRVGRRGGDVGAPARRDEAIARHGEDPGREIGVGRQPRRVPRDRKPDLLVQILGDVAPPGEAQQETEARLREARVQLAERRALAPPQAVDERGVIGEPAII